MNYSDSQKSEGQKLKDRHSDTDILFHLWCWLIDPYHTQKKFSLNPKKELTEVIVT